MAIGLVNFSAYAPAPVSSGQRRKVQQYQTSKSVSTEKSAGKQSKIAQLEAKISNLTSQLKLKEPVSPQDIAKIEKIEAEIEEAKTELEEVKHLNILA